MCFFVIEEANIRKYELRFRVRKILIFVVGEARILDSEFFFRDRKHMLFGGWGRKILDRECFSCHRTNIVCWEYLNLQTFKVLNVAGPN